MTETPIIITNLEKQKANIVLDASKIDLFETCRRRYQIRYMLQRVLPKHQKAEALDKGSLAHAGFETYFKTLRDNVPYNDRIELSLAKINELASNPDESNLDDTNVEMITRGFQESCEYWRHDDENCLEILAVEEPFAYVLYEDDFVRIILSGKIDLLVNYHGIGRQSSYARLPYDHKTFSRDSMVLRKTNQFINYAAACGSNYLMVNRVGLYAKSSKLKPEEKFKRVPLSYDPIYINDWKQNVTKMILNEYLTCLANNEWPEINSSCNKFNRLCEYYEICDSSGIEAKEFKLNDNYVTAEEWDVTKGLTGLSGLKGEKKEE